MFDSFGALFLAAAVFFHLVDDRAFEESGEPLPFDAFGEISGVVPGAEGAVEALGFVVGSLEAVGFEGLGME